jgi:hypothetical protein
MATAPRATFVVTVFASGRICTSGLTPTRKAAEAKEASIAEELRKQGYTVYSG